MQKVLRSLVACLVVSFALAAVGRSQDAPAQENTPESLESVFVEIHKAIHVDKSPEKALAILKGLLPDEERLKAALKPDVAKDVLDKVVAMHKELGSKMTAETIAGFCKPEQTEVQVHGATTEEIAANAEGSVAFAEFPGGAQRVAAHLRPKLTFYEVEYLEPGQDAGMKYHLFYWDGKQWSMLGPVWRAIK